MHAADPFGHRAETGLLLKQPVLDGYEQSNLLLTFNRFACSRRAEIRSRIGSSEKDAYYMRECHIVHCRIGSSEKRFQLFRPHLDVHCRIGSSEKLLEHVQSIL